MAEVQDVAFYILTSISETSAWKLQKLVYYSQAWHSVWRDEPLFEERIEAWANGPVCPELYKIHRGRFTVSAEIIRGDASRLTDSEKDSIDRVIAYYSHYNGQQLSDLTHLEDPWRHARQGLADHERGSSEITLEAMSEYYGSL